MKIIQSEGGPLIGLDRKLVQNWGGAADKRYTDKASRFESDYEVLEDVYPRGAITPHVAKIVGVSGAAPLITMPYETAIVKSGRSSIYLAQVDIAPRNWVFSMIEDYLYTDVKYRKENAVVFSVEDCEFMLFDAAYAAEWIGDDYLSFPLQAGYYEISDATYRDNDKLSLILLKIERLK